MLTFRKLQARYHSVMADFWAYLTDVVLRERMRALACGDWDRVTHCHAMRRTRRQQIEKHILINRSRGFYGRC